MGEILIILLLIFVNGIFAVDEIVGESRQVPVFRTGGYYADRTVDRMFSGNKIAALFSDVLVRAGLNEGLATGPAGRRTVYHI